MLIDKFNVKAQVTNSPPNNGSIGRMILSYADFKKKISLIPMEQEIREIILGRVHKYPEASLDYVWKRLQDFVSTASRERAERNRRMHVPEVKVEPPNQLIPVIKEEVKKIKPLFVRPSFDFEEFEIPNKEEVKDDAVSKEGV